MTIGGALRWRHEAAPVFEERVKLARAGRMDEIADHGRRDGAERGPPGLGPGPSWACSAT